MAVHAVIANEPTAKLESVMPSLPLINILHRKLRDPSIVSSFERHRARHLTEGLARPRWVLTQAKEGDDAAADNDSAADVKSAAANVISVINDASKQNGGAVNENHKHVASGDAGDCAGADADNPGATTASIKNQNGVNNSQQKDSGGNKADNCPINNTSRKEDTKYNTIPKRNYIDLRMEQNRMFANDQSVQCQQILSKLTLPSSSNNTNQWKKRVDTIQSLLNEGLAACPNHVGLLSAEKVYKGWIQRRIHSLTTGGEGLKSATPNNTSDSTTKDAAANTATEARQKDTITILPNPYPCHPKKGAEGRAQAAMRDALLERSFMLGDTGEDGKDDVQYPILSTATANDEQLGELKRGETVVKQGENVRDANSSSGSSIDEDRRRRRRSNKHKKHKRGRKRHSRDDGRRRNREERSSSRRSRCDSRSVSRSRSRSISASSSSSSRSSSHRRRKHRRKEKKRRRSHRRSRSKRYRSEEEDDDGHSCDESGREMEGEEAR
mmetsp:Transcript_18247/g.39434  ORF Transcript_18247/g.39434 Transcript_18247/m.39434 type:complete len:498 (-) Transcript_18247:722-2215(-)